MLTMKLLRFRRIDELLERVHIGNCELREHLAVDRDVCLRELVDERAVGYSAHARSGVDTGDPEFAHIAFFCATVFERMLQSLTAAVFRCAVKHAVSADISLYGLEYLLLSSMVNYTCC